MKPKDRLCWHCVHINFDGGDSGWSEWTPGHDALISCMKGCFYSAMKDLEMAEFRRFLETAKTCKDFEMRGDE